MATAEKRVVTDATGQAMLAELRKIPGVMNPLPIEKGGTGAATPEGAREAIGAQEKLGFNVSEELNKRIKSVNETLPDENGNVQIVRVPMADNFTSDESHVVSGTFIERTTGGDTSITDGNAYLGVLYGNSVRTGYTAETKNIETRLVERVDDSQPMTAEINWDTFRTAVSGISTNKTFSYTSVWNENPETYGITVGGTPKNGDVINVYFIAENRGTIANATPETFNSTNWNLYDNETGYAKVLKYSDVHGFKIGGTYTGVSFSATVDGEKTVVTPDSDGLFTIPSDGYVFVTGGNDTDTYVLMTWSDWEDGYTGDFLTKNVSTIDFSEVMQNVFPFGLCAIGIVTDEINFNDRVATVRIERIAYSTENRIAAENSGRDFIYDANWIYSVKETPEKVRFNVDNDLVVYDHGVEYFTGTEVPLTAFELFGQNLKDKLRREVVAVTPQNFSASQKQIARENIEAAWNSEVIKSINNKVPDANGNITIVEGQSNASYGSYRVDPVIPPAAWSLVNGQYQVAYSDPLIKSTMTGSETWLDDNDVVLGKTSFDTIDGALLIVTTVQPTETWRLHVLLAENGATVLEEVHNKVDENDLAIVENDDTAFNNITAGQYVMWKGEMYKATAAIASGATLSATGSGANLTAVNNGVANELNAGISSLDSKVGNVGNTDLQSQITALNSKLLYKTKLTSSDDMNTIAEGTYYASANSLPANRPESVSAHSFIECFDCSQTEVLEKYQRYTAMYSGIPITWERRYYDGTWGNWIKILNESDIVYPLMYTRNGWIINSELDEIKGNGVAMIELHANGIAIIHVHVLISTAGSSDTFAYGVNRDAFTAICGKTITPIAGGIATFYTPAGQINGDLTGYGGTWTVNSQFWTPARNYDWTSVGGWPANQFTASNRIEGVLYGTWA